MALYLNIVRNFPVLVLTGYLLNEVKWKLLKFRPQLSRLLFVLSGQAGGDV